MTPIKVPCGLYRAVPLAKYVTKALSRIKYFYDTLIVTALSAAKQIVSNRQDVTSASFGAFMLVHSYRLKGYAIMHVFATIWVTCR